MKELMAMVGKRGCIKVNGWYIAVEIHDVKKVFGTEKLEAHGVFGEVQWINRDSFIEVPVTATQAVKIVNVVTM